MKQCFKCKETKPLGEFYKHRGMADGHLNKCKDCTKRDAWLHRQENIDRIREYDRGRNSLPHRVASRTANTSAYRVRYPERYKATTAVNNALKRGAITKTACWVCGEAEVDAHHADYSRPLDVIWLCVMHHRQIHLAYPDEFYAHPTTRTELPEWQFRAKRSDDVQVTICRDSEYKPRF